MRRQLACCAGVPCARRGNQASGTVIVPPSASSAVSASSLAVPGGNRFSDFSSRNTHAKPSPGVIHFLQSQPQSHEAPRAQIPGSALDAPVRARTWPRSHRALNGGGAARVCPLSKRTTVWSETQNCRQRCQRTQDSRVNSIRFRNAGRKTASTLATDKWGVECSSTSRAFSGIRVIRSCTSGSNRSPDKHRKVPGWGTSARSLPR